MLAILRQGTMPVPFRQTTLVAAGVAGFPRFASVAMIRSGPPSQESGDLSCLWRTTAENDMAAVG